MLEVKTNTYMLTALVFIRRAAEPALFQGRICNSVGLFVGSWVGYNTSSEESKEQECRGCDLGEMHLDRL